MVPKPFSSQLPIQLPFLICQVLSAFPPGYRVWRVWPQDDKREICSQEECHPLTFPGTTCCPLRVPWGRTHTHSLTYLTQGFISYWERTEFYWKWAHVSFRRSKVMESWVLFPTFSLTPWVKFGKIIFYHLDSVLPSFFFNLLGWQLLVKLHRFQVCNSVSHHP